MPKKILLADDSITIQKVVELTFSDGDYEVTATNNGARAIQKLGEMRPDIILSDIIMPERNGYEVCEYVKSHPDLRNIPVILLTGTFEPFDPDRAEKAGCDAVVTKPFESQNLIHKVEELIAASQQAPAPEPAQAFEEPESFQPAAQAAAPAFEEPSAFGQEAPAFDQVAPAFEPEAETRAYPMMGFAPPPPPSFTEESPFEAPAAHEEPPAFEPAAEEPIPGFEHGPDIFGTAPPEAAPQSMPFESSFGTEAPAFAPSSFDESPLGGVEAGGMPADEAPFAGGFDQPSPIEEPAADMFGTPQREERVEEKPAFQSFGGFGEEAATPSAPFDQPPPLFGQEETPQETAAEPAAMPFEEPQSSYEPESSYETQQPAFAPQAFEELHTAETTEQPLFGTAPTEAAFSEEAQTSSFAEPEPAPSIDDAETRAFPKMTFEEIARAESQQQARPEPAQQEAAPSPWAEEEEPAAEWPEEAPAPSSPAAAWEASIAQAVSQEKEPSPEAFIPPAAASPFEEAPAEEQAAPAAEETPFEEPAAVEGAEDLPFEAPAGLAGEEPPSFTPSMPPPVEEQAPSPSWGASEAVAAMAVAMPESFTTPPPPPPPSAMSVNTLTNDQIDLIARRVVEMISADIVKNIAWEVVPDLAEMIVKERIRQLEAEA